MRILIGIPCLYCAEHCKKAIDSVIGKSDVTILLIDNGAEPAVKELLNKYDEGWFVSVVNYEKNIYVNPAWNAIMQIFLGTDYDYLIIMNSDLIMQKNFDQVIKNRWKQKPDEILVPRTTDNDRLLKIPVHTYVEDAKEVTEGTPGVFITMNRKQCEMVYPIPHELKIWFGDSWIFTILRNAGYKTVIPENLISYHYWSQTVQRVEGIGEMIEEDKRQWELIKHRVNEKIK